MTRNLKNFFCFQSRAPSGLSAPKLAWLGLFALSIFPYQTLSAPASDQPPSYRLESLEVVGSNRIPNEQMYEQLRINNETIMSDEWLADSRTKLMGLGLYRYVFFSLQKGSKPGFAKLLITVQEDDSVLSDWAAGGEFGLSLVKPAPDIGDTSIFRSYRLGLVARNILRQSHRGAMLAEIGTDGSLALGSLAYGLPRFVNEAIQFDGALSVIDPRQKYLEAEGFGMKAQALWTRQRGGFDLAYGLVWYSNRHARYQLDKWPSLVSGPKIALVRETRLLKFLPHQGYKASFAIIPSLVNRQLATIETELSQTFLGPDIGALTIAGKGMAIGKTAQTVRGELKYELPIVTSSHGLRSILYVSRRLGFDQLKATKYTGSETLAGYRYHSTGFIGDINFKIASDNPFSKRLLGNGPKANELDMSRTGVGP